MVMSNLSDPPDSEPRLKLGFLLQPEFTLMALSSMLEALRVAADQGGRSRQIQCRWNIMTPSAVELQSSSGLIVQPDIKLLPPEEFDYVVVVGGLLSAHKKIEAGFYDYIRTAAHSRTPLIGACTGSFLLARAGVMEGYRSCVHHYHRDAFETEFPNLQVNSDQLYLIDRDRITCPGGGSPMDVAVHLINQHCGEDSARKVMNLFIFDEARSGRHPQSHFSSEWIGSIHSPLVERAISIMQSAISKPRKITDIASILSVSSKKLEREFQKHLSASPKSFYQRLRLDRALWLLRHTDSSLSIISSQCGYADASHFTLVFKKHFKLTPRAARIKLQQGEDDLEHLVLGDKMQTELLAESVESRTLKR